MFDVAVRHLYICESFGAMKIILLRIKMVRSSCESDHGGSRKSSLCTMGAPELF